MVRSGFQFANPILERVSFVTNNKFDSDKFEGIDIESQTSVEMHGRKYSESVFKCYSRKQ